MVNFIMIYRQTGNRYIPTLDLINNNISRNVQEKCANRLYRVFTLYPALWMVENNEYLTDY